MRKTISNEKHEEEVELAQNEERLNEELRSGFIDLSNDLSVTFE